MAVRKKSPAKKNGASTNKYFVFSTDKKKKILGIFLIVFSLFTLLSIASYSRYDQAVLNYHFSDLFKVLSNNQETVQKANDTHNMLGIFGAYISDFFVNSTFGIFSTVFPIMFFLWGFSVFRKINFRILIYTSNFLIIIGLLLSSFFGVFREHYSTFVKAPELSGAIGDYLGLAVSRLLGGVGAFIFLTATTLVLLIVAFDIKIEKLFHFVANAITGSVKKAKEEYQNAKVETNDDSNLKKIKNLREEKKKKKTTPLPGEKSAKDLMDEEEEETKIKIVRKDEEEKLVVQDENKVLKEEDKKVDLHKTKEAPQSEIDRNAEAMLPNQWDEKIDYRKLNLDLLEPIPSDDFKVAEEELTRNAELLKEKLKLFDIDIEDITVTPGPVVTLYEIVPAPGVKISRIVGLEHDIALALAARGIRIIAPIPGKSAIGVEIPNAEASLVNARSVLGKISESKYELPVALGKTINGDVYYADLAKMPHMLIAGSTGSGKSVGINMIIASLLYSKHPSEVKLIMIDPKKIELSFYNKLRKHYLAVSPDLEEEIITNPQNAVLLLKSVEYEMEKRYDKLAKTGVRNLVDYNKKVSDPKKRPPDTDEMKHHPIPYLVVIIDELADLMITAGKEVEEPIARLAQLARAVGIHLVVATQRPSVNVITGVIKANFSARIAYQVATKIDSRTILDMNGAEQLLGQRRYAVSSNRHA